MRMYVAKWADGSEFRGPAGYHMIMGYNPFEDTSYPALKHAGTYLLHSAADGEHWSTGWEVYSTESTYHRLLCLGAPNLKEEIQTFE